MVALQAAAARKLGSKPTVSRSSNTNITPSARTGTPDMSMPEKNKPGTKKSLVSPGAKIGIPESPTSPKVGLVKKYRGKYIGKESYGGLTRNAPKGKYKGKYIGPDKYKGDVAAWERDKEAQRLKKARNKKAPGKITTQPVGNTLTAPIK